MIDQLKQYQIFKNKEIETFTLLKNQGYCNENYLLKAEDKKYLIRKFKLQNDRKFEFKVQKLAYEKNIAAEPILLDDENGLMICEFLEGKHKIVLDKYDLKKLAQVLKELHSIKLNTMPLNLESALTSKSKEIKQAFVTLGKYEVEEVLCHNDLNPKNILFTDEVKFIDWEFASVNDRYFDLASVCIEFDLDTKDETHFLEHYFAIREEIYMEKLSGYKAIYKALCAQWFEVLKTTLQ
ncbi:choline/ethanolamine kinase family protein [Sulfurovum sp. CS9]|uniref:choline/ethanolamine kinase family protein n=1 Tax=Sulfurovum sp. CS9 TaxID=3391146 RepID=UPI0039EA7A07